MRLFWIGLLLLAGSGCNSNIEVDCKNMTVKVSGENATYAMDKAKEMLKECR